jgi:hypothetical protein
MCSQRIYFDGYLPPSKLDVRLERLRALTKRLNDYYHANPVPCRIPIRTEETDSEYLSRREPISSSPTTLPSVPFLVPVIIDALGNSETYKAVVEVVPGEADLYCARYLKQHRGTVITGDSDLLVHDLGAYGSVCFFRDIEPFPDTKSSALHSLVYHPADIADRLALTESHGLRALAFEMSQDSQGTFRKLLLQATALKAVNTHGEQYVEFLTEYKPLPADSSLTANSGGGRHLRFMEALQNLDPRVSEYVLQFPSLQKRSGQTESAAKPEVGPPHVFLPFLLDCPARISAWEVSTSLRQLAYGIIKYIVPKSEQEYSVFEHRRQNNMSGKGWQLSNIPAIPQACMALINLIDQVHCKFPTLSVLDRWIVFVICQEAAWCASTGRPVLSNLVVQDLLRIDLKTERHIECTWNIVQFLAQVQGVFYSLRMLQQITSLSLLCRQTDTLPETVFILHDRLKSLPSLGDIPDLSSVMTLIQKIEAKDMVKAAHGMMGIEEQKSSEVQETSKKANKKRKTSKRLALQSNERKNASNPFALLDVE